MFLVLAITFLVLRARLDAQKSEDALRLSAILRRSPGAHLSKRARVERVPALRRRSRLRRRRNLLGVGVAVVEPAKEAPPRAAPEPARNVGGNPARLPHRAPFHLEHASVPRVRLQRPQSRLHASTLGAESPIVREENALRARRVLLVQRGAFSSKRLLALAIESRETRREVRVGGASRRFEGVRPRGDRLGRSEAKRRGDSRRTRRGRRRRVDEVDVRARVEGRGEEAREGDTGATRVDASARGAELVAEYRASDVDDAAGRRLIVDRAVPVGSDGAVATRVGRGDGGRRAAGPGGASGREIFASRRLAHRAVDVHRAEGAIRLVGRGGESRRRAHRPTRPAVVRRRGGRGLERPTRAYLLEIVSRNARHRPVVRVILRRAAEEHPRVAARASPRAIETRASATWSVFRNAQRERGSREKIWDFGSLRARRIRIQRRGRASLVRTKQAARLAPKIAKGRPRITPLRDDRRAHSARPLAGTHGVARTSPFAATARRSHREEAPRPWRKRVTRRASDRRPPRRSW